MLCRVVFSNWWTYTAIVVESTEVVEDEVNDQKASVLMESNTQNNEEMLYNRLLTFSLTFNADELTATTI